MKNIFLLIFLFLNLHANDLLIINSNSNIEKYANVQQAFIKNYKGDYKVLDLLGLSKKQIEEYLYDEYPDIVYTIGTKAFSYANMYIPEKTIFFSSIVNYKRLNIQNNRYGVSNELYIGMNLTIIKSLFSKLDSFSIIYSEYTKDLYLNFKQNASTMGIKIVGQEISKNKDINKKLLKDSDGLIMIADPILLKDEKVVIDLFKEMNKLKKPIFAYHELFIQYGASLVISAHNKTIGAQVASMINHFKNNKDFSKIQSPMGTNVIFNKKVADTLEVQYNTHAFPVINKVVE